MRCVVSRTLTIAASVMYCVSDTNCGSYCDVLCFGHELSQPVRCVVSRTLTIAASAMYCVSDTKCCSQLNQSDTANINGRSKVPNLF